MQLLPHRCVTARFPYTVAHAIWVVEHMIEISNGNVAQLFVLLHSIQHNMYTMHAQSMQPLASVEAETLQVGVETGSNNTSRCS